MLMMIHKILHLNQPLELAKRRLAHLSRFYSDVTGAKATLDGTDATLQWRLRTPLGLTQPLQITACPSGVPGKYLFQSSDIQLKVVGYLQYHEVKRNLTELEIAVYYEVRPFVLRWVDRIFNAGNILAHRQLDKLRAHLAGEARPVPWPPIAVEAYSPAV